MVVAIPRSTPSSSHITAPAPTKPSVLKRVAAFALKYFNLASAICVLGYGLIEIAYFGIWTYYKLKKGDQKGTTEKADKATRWLKEKVRNFHKRSTLTSFAHGSAYAISGTCSLIAATNHLGWSSFLKAVPWFSLGNIFFLFASAISLEQNVVQLRKAREIASQAPKLAHQMKVSAIFGIVNSIGYLLSTLCLMVGTPMAFALVFGALAITTGCVKILYDFFIQFRKKEI